MLYIRNTYYIVYLIQIYIQVKTKKIRSHELKLEKEQWKFIGRGSGRKGKGEIYVQLKAADYPRPETLQ